MKKLRIALIENFGEDFYMFRVSLAKFLISQGYDVIAIVPKDEYAVRIKEAGIQIETYNLDRNSINPIRITRSLLSLRNIIRNREIDIVHTFRLQPNIMGTLAAKLAKVKFIVNHITGLGIAFSSGTLRSKFFMFTTIVLYKFVFSLTSCVIFQNPDDIKTFRKFILCNRKKIQLIKGSGINCYKYSPWSFNRSEVDKITAELNINSDHLVFTMISRLIWHKGINEFVMAAKTLNMKYSHLKFLVVGGKDDANPQSIEDKYIKLHNTDVIFLGKRSEIKSILYLSDVYVLPSFYREGIPRTILEAMAMAKPIVTTTMPGCNLTVEQNRNGFLIKPKDTNELVSSLEKFIKNRDLINQFGNYSRQKAIKDFSENVIFSQISELYRNLSRVVEKDY